MIMKKSIPDFMTLLGFVVAALFIGFGIYILFSHKMDNVPKEFRTIFGVVVIVYGIFRSVVIYQKSKQRRDLDDETEY
jgi:prepilin signal peptidase PulO-like enzyme (type II secretory pathway)